MTIPRLVKSVEMLTEPGLRSTNIIRVVKIEAAVGTGLATDRRTNMNGYTVQAAAKIGSERVVIHIIHHVEPKTIDVKTSENTSSWE